jgi:hypothetical protein
MLNERDWPVPPLAHVYDSRIDLIRPHSPSINILTTCRLIHDEARLILQRKTEHCITRPVRYLVDYSAAWVLIGGSLRSCLGVANGGNSRYQNIAVRTFVRACTLFLSRHAKNRTRGQRAIEMTISHKTEVAYGIEVIQTMVWLCELSYFYPTRLVVIYKSPLPRTCVVGDRQARDSSEIEAMLLQQVPREPENSSQVCAVFVRPLKEEAF